MSAVSPIDTTLDFREDSGGRDSDRHSRTLRDYHARLWSRPLPGGDVFNLQPVRVRGSYLLRYAAATGDIFLSSDILANSSKRPCRQFYDLVPGDVRLRFHTVGLTIGGRLIFPAEGVGGLQTINQRRGTHPRIRDRFDLTLECIRRHYSGEESPLRPVLEANRTFFSLFRDFERYVDFFLLHDLWDGQASAIRYYLPFEGFDRPALPRSADDYRRFLDRQIAFVEARNYRIRELML